MYKSLLCLRYLRTRYIALASIISVTLGVATMIVVNSVMAGFIHEMHVRLHGILSDIICESHGLGGFMDVSRHIDEIAAVVGDEDLEGVTASVHVPAMLNFQYRGQWITRQVNLIGVDEATYAQVSDFGKYLLHPENRKQLSFLLREAGYDGRFPYDPGWNHRRARIEFERSCEAERQRAYESDLRWTEQQEVAHGPENSGGGTGARGRFPVSQANALEEESPISLPFTPLEAEPTAANYPATGQPTDGSKPAVLPPFAPGEADIPRASRPRKDPFLAAPRRQSADVFDEMNEQYTGIILGIAVVSVRQADKTGQVKDLFLCVPGDDVQLTFPTCGTPPQAVSDTFTIVDLYESKMSEYDSSFAFMPLKKLQHLRGMIDPLTGQAAVTSIQIKLKEDADLNAVRDRLAAAFPAEQYPYHIRTWQEMQGPLLAAVQLETTILNILLFLIIAVAGFGILATFYMIVVEKTKDIGILKSLGAPSGGVMSIFLGYGLSLGIVGSGVGLVLGLLFVININHIARVVEWITGQKVFDPSVYYFREIPTIVNPLTISWIVAGAMVIAVLASVLPAIRAARLHPVEALRYE